MCSHIFSKLLRRELEQQPSQYEPQEVEQVTCLSVHWRCGGGFKEGAVLHDKPLHKEKPAAAAQQHPAECPQLIKAAQEPVQAEAGEQPQPNQCPVASKPSSDGRPPSGSGACPAAVNTSIFQKLGGWSALTATTDLFYKKLLSDPSLARFFEGVPMHRLVKKQTEFMAFAFGGANDFFGKNVAFAHRTLIKEHGLNLTHFDAVAAHFKDTLTELKLPQQVIDEAVAVVLTTRPMFDAEALAQQEDNSDAAQAARLHQRLLKLKLKQQAKRSASSSPRASIPGTKTDPAQSPLGGSDVPVAPAGSDTPTAKRSPSTAGVHGSEPGFQTPSKGGEGPLTTSAAGSPADPGSPAEGPRARRAARILNWIDKYTGEENSAASKDKQQQQQQEADKAVNASSSGRHASSSSSGMSVDDSDEDTPKSTKGKPTLASSAHQKGSKRHPDATLSKRASAAAADAAQETTSVK